MLQECFDQSGLLDDEDDISGDEYEDYDEEGVLLKGGQLFKKALGPAGRREGDSVLDPKGAKKKHKHDAKNRYWRKHRDDVAW